MRQRLFEKQLISEATKKTKKVIVRMSSWTVSPRHMAVLDYFDEPLTKKVNLRSVLEAHSANLTKEEMNEIIRLHN